MSFSKKTLLLLTLLLSTRLIGIDWGNGNFYHPDENNMARSLESLSFSSLDPNFYAYGQLPVYLGFFTLKILGLQNSFSSSVYILRIISTIASILSVWVFYKLVSTLNPKSAFVSTLLFILIPGNIQLSHFGTTESMLILFYLLIFYLSPKKLIFASAVLGLAIGLKISSFIFILPIIFATVKLKKHINLLKSFVTILIFISISSPYYIINTKEFLSSMHYETDVARGILKVFYTSQFLHTTPYLFQINKIFPYAWGLPVFILFFISIVKNITQKKYFIILLTSAIYFLYFGQLYTKWFRFMSPLFFLAPIFVGNFIVGIKNTFLKKITLTLCLAPGILFFTRYFSIDQRVLVNQYIEHNIEGNILSEGGNVVNLNKTYNFDFYSLDSVPALQYQLDQYINNSDYIIVPSRRIFSNQNNQDFPASAKYYNNLFSSNLGFSPIKTFSYFPPWFNYESAEETFTVFDNPTIRIFKKNE